jgi:NAD(P)H-dependent flavin oxidoreductase YrpB (nitropropane dioxygenase family)
VIDGDVEGGSLMAGQSVGFVTREQSTAEIIEELVSQALAVLAARSEGMRQRRLVSHELLPGSQAPADD